MKRKNSYLCIDNTGVDRLATKGKVYVSRGRNENNEDLIKLDQGSIDFIPKDPMFNFFKLIEPKEPIKRISPIENGLITRQCMKIWAIKRLIDQLLLSGNKPPLLRKCKEIVDMHGCNTNQLINLINDGVITV